MRVSLNDVMHKLGRIEGQLTVVDKLAERLSRLEQRQFWLKGALAVLLATFAYISHAIYGR